MNKKLARRLAAALVVPLMLVAAACGSDDDSSAGVSKAPDAVDGGPVTIVGQDFAEADILVYLYKGLLDNAGFQATVTNLGGRDLYLKPLQEGEKFQISTDYLSSMTEALNRQANGEDAPLVASNDPVATLAELNKLVAPKLTALKPSEAQDANGYAITKKFSEENGNITTLSQLGALGKPLKLAAAPDCKTRPDCGKGLTQTYGLNITEYLKFEFGDPGVADALKKGEVQVGQFGTSDPTIETNDFVLLEDDKSLQNAENLVPIVNTAWLQEHPQAEAALDSLSAVLTTDDLRTMIGQVKIGREKAADVALAYLKAKDLLK